jgi:transposase
LRRGFDALSAQVQNVLNENPFSGEIYIFRGRHGDKVKVLWYSEDGLCLFYKRLSDGKFVWPSAKDGTISLSPAQLSMLLEGIDWRRPKRTTPSPKDPEKRHPRIT